MVEGDNQIGSLHPAGKLQTIFFNTTPHRPIQLGSILTIGYASNALWEASSERNAVGAFRPCVLAKLK
jgi:hypothetical protein